MSAGSARHELRSTRYPAERLPAACLAERCVIGIDEAGRGPVLGPLVYAVFVCPESHTHWLASNGANDSKQLSAESRESFFNTLLAGEGPARDLGWRAKVLHPEYISNCMLRREKYNLNELSYDAVFGTVAGLLAAGVAVSEAFVDTLGQAEKYEAVLTAKFPGVKFVVRSKADSLFPVVGAASIVAKVLRDDLLAAWGIGASGYPGDPQTVSWLRENVDPVFGFPSVVRFSWSSCAALLQEKCCPVTWCDADDDGHAGRDARRPQKSLLSKRSTVPPSRLLLCDLFPTAEGAKKQKY